MVVNTIVHQPVVLGTITQHDEATKKLAHRVPGSGRISEPREDGLMPRRIEVLHSNHQLLRQSIAKARVMMVKMHFVRSPVYDQLELLSSLGIDIGRK